jgi:hypothetical protein
VESNRETDQGSTWTAAPAEEEKEICILTIQHKIVYSLMNWK